MSKRPLFASGVRLGVDYIKVILPFLLLGMALFALAWPFVEPAPPERFRIATGMPGGAYERMGQAYQRYFAEQGFVLESHASAGSVENWQKLLRGEVDAAIVQSGTRPLGVENQLQAVVSLTFEPLFIFYRQRDFSAQKAPGDQLLFDLDSYLPLNLAIGADGSGTQSLMTGLLQLHTESLGRISTDLTLQGLGGEAAYQALKEGSVDFASFVMAADAPLLQRLLADPELGVVDFVRANAISQRLPFLSPVVLHQGVVDLQANLPGRDVQLVAPSAYLVVRKDAHRALVQLLIEAARQAQSTSSLTAPQGYFPNLAHMDLPVAEEAEYFFQRGPSFLYRHLPFGLAILVDRLAILILPLLAILIPLSRMAPPALRWRIRRRIYRWYRKLRLMDNALLESALTEAQLHSYLQQVRQLEDEVANTEVPLSYMEEFYNLRLHVAYIRQRLETRLSS
ncbi:TAXI family TRAP transporter solute-binding subunit [Nitrincola tapanii]|nr:TAXI family TRAP transporter solute-binding subunit [Nitrincola tapanii]